VATAKRLLREQDAVILAERLLAWSDKEIAKDLAAYADVDPREAIAARDTLLGWLRERPEPGNGSGDHEADLAPHAQHRPGRVLPGRRHDGPPAGVPGHSQHPAAEELPALLRRPEVARKYTREALRIASWHILSKFPRRWLLAMLPKTPLRSGRARALKFLLAEPQASGQALRDYACRLSTASLP